MYALDVLARWSVRGRSGPGEGERLSASTFRAEGRRRRADLQFVKVRQWGLCEAYHLIARAVSGPISPGAIAEARAALVGGDQEALYVVALLLSTERSCRRILRLVGLVRLSIASRESVAPSGKS